MTGHVRPDGIPRALSTDAIWRIAGSGPESSLETAVERAQSEHGVAREQLMVLLADDALREQQRVAGWSGHRLEIAALLTLAVTVLVLLALSAFRTIGLLPPPLDIPGTVVAGSGGLPAFHVVRAGDVRPAQAGSAAASERQREVTGRFTLMAVRPNAAVRDEHLSAPCGPAASSVDREKRHQLLSLPLRTGALSRAKPGDCVTLLLAPRLGSTAVADSTDSRIFSNVTLLSAVIEGNSVSTLVAIALSDADLEDLQRLLGTTDVFVLRAARPLAQPQSAGTGSGAGGLTE